MKVLVFDTETTGLPETGASINDKSKWPYIIQLSYILYDISNNSALIKDNYIKIDDSVIITPESFNIHHINREILDCQGINIVDALKEFNDCLNLCDVIVSHNILFDKRLILVECLRHNITPNFTQLINNIKINKPEYCTMKNTREFCKLERISKTNKVYNKMPKLSELYALLFPSEPLPKDLHNSLVDVAITLRCYVKYLHNSDVKEVNENIRALFYK